MEKHLKTSYLIKNFNALDLPTEPSYELACAICDFTDEKHWQPLIEQICENNDLALTVLQRASSGENPTFLLESASKQSFYIKLIAPNWLFQYHHEAEALRLCDNASLPIATPKLIAHGEINNWGYIVTEGLEGQLLSDVYNELTLEEQKSIADQLGRFCLQMHSMPMEKSSVLYKDWQAFIEAQYHNSYARRKRQGLRADFLADFIPYIAHTPYKAPETSNLYLIHSDLHPGNLLVKRTDSGAILSGVIDFGDAIICNEPVFEFTTVGLLIAKGRSEVFQQFLESYLYQIDDKRTFLNSLMTLTLLRHTGNLNYLIEYVPGVKQCTNWPDAEQYLFPFP
ncbi:aminoglycoside phosphotransferase family protein [Pseudoalteromonas sp. G4]|uniref:aminoglycoside phosphotransferase family protein n=1 Tax=Pseudoalteromonas sp. G4 TaxID=2992761 RepID=UPI00237DC7CB|nr:aminoglycoside phosphotransferase family protein [Pseudoalteromonas sp. G4]MDE3272347.1 aminoglycoside phosphotransferase family protein [Pseudoalteromonas sp. G4]